MKTEMAQLDFSGAKIIRTEKRYFAYKASHKGIWFWGKANQSMYSASGDVNFWSIENRGYKTKAPAARIAEQEAVYGEQTYDEIGVMEFTLYYTENEYGCERPLRWSSDNILHFSRRLY